MERQGLDQAELIRRAAAEAAHAAEEMLGGLQGRKVAVACGKGVNAADGLTAAALMAKAGASVTLELVFSPADLCPQASQALEQALGVGCEVAPAEEESEVFKAADLCIDALVGTGSRLPLQDELAACVDALNDSGRPVLALDLPSGVDALSGAVPGKAVRAEATLSFVAVKPGLVQLPARAYTGRLLCADLGVDETLAAGLAPLAFYFDAGLAARSLPVRRPDQHKKQAVVLVVAGSETYAGAALLCARAAYRVGAGLVHLAVPACLRSLAQAALPEAVVHGLGKGASLDASLIGKLLELAAGSQAAVVGPGLGRQAETLSLCAALWQSLPCPSVFDADALHALRTGLGKTAADRVLSPHEGEFAVLTKAWGMNKASGRFAELRSLAQACDAVVLRKGPGTLSARPDGTLAVNSTGGPVLASAGTGDVLAGAIGGLLAQGATAFDAAALGAWLHGRVAEHWAERYASRGLLASDVVDGLPAAIGELERAEHLHP